MIHHFTACRVSGDKNLVFPDQKTAELDDLSNSAYFICRKA